MIDEGKIDFITFTSSSTVENFVKAMGAEILNKTKTAAIGPITEQTLKKFADTEILWFRDKRFTRY